MGYKMNIRIEYNDKLSSAKLRAGRQFVYNWMVNGSQQLVIAPVCEAYIGENSVQKTLEPILKEIFKENPQITQDQFVCIAIKK